MAIFWEGLNGLTVRVNTVLCPYALILEFSYSPMKTLFFSLLLLAAVTGNAQVQSLDSALTKARTEHKQVLLRFSGSDWCIPCIRMEKEIFGDAGFHSFAAPRFVDIQADFPRLKKHRLPHAQQEANEALAARYNPQGTFPLTVLLDADGKVVRRWEGLVDNKAAFVAQLEALQPK
jgi:thioredoxin-related protein